MNVRDNVLAAFRHEETLWTPNVLSDMNLVLQSTVNERYEGKTAGKDEFGVSYTYMAQSDTPIVTPGTELLEDITDWKSIRFPKVEDYDWDEGAKRDTAAWDRANKANAVMLYNGPFERMHALMGFENALVALLTEPEAVSDYLDAFVEYRCSLIRKIAKHYKPDAIMLFDDYGTSNGMMMSPEIWRSLFKPHLKKLIDTTKECNMFYILHSCGYIKPIFPDFVELGPDVVQPMQHMNGVKELKDQYGGKITFTGGFRALEVLDNPSATEEEMREEVQRGLNELAPGGSYIAWQTLLSPKAKRIFLEEVMKVSEPKMRALNIRIPDWRSISF
jgi:uroporphyrinogen-III decarboxylase